jgi:hypothetical protein
VYGNTRNWLSERALGQKAVAGGISDRETPVQNANDRHEALVPSGKQKADPCGSASRGIELVELNGIEPMTS